MTVFSIVTVVRNDRDGFVATRQSIATQSFRGYEWIVVDGTSTDGTGDAVAEAEAAGEIARRITGADRGPYDAMNAGKAVVQGLFVLFLNAGDRLVGSDILERLNGVVADRSPDLLYGDHVVDRRDGTAAVVPAFAPEAIHSRMIASHQSILYRRSLMDSLDYDCLYAVAADYVLTLHALMRDIRVVRVSYPICRVAPAGISARNARQGRAEQARARRQILGMSRFGVMRIRLIQAAAWRLRAYLPTLYERIRRHRRM